MKNKGKSDPFDENAQKDWEANWRKKCGCSEPKKSKEKKK
jgi:hypothetical protein